MYLDKESTQITALQYNKKSETDNDTYTESQSERITIQGSRKSIAFVGKESNRLISDAFAERQNEPKGELRTPSQAMSAVRAEPGR